jgi:SET domain-containing protein
VADTTSVATKQKRRKADTRRRSTANRRRPSPSRATAAGRAGSGRARGTDGLAFEIRTSSIQGRGAFATRPIRRGTRIIEYVGERISHAEADRRYVDEDMDRHHTFLFTVNSRVVVDAAVGGNEARFINHSCAPNCEAVIERGRIYIDALRDIPVGAELCYDYAYEWTADDDPGAEARYPCRCGAPECRGTIMAPPG